MVTDAAAAAIVVAFRHFGENPLHFKTSTRLASPARYYAFRILWDYMDKQGVQVPAQIWARYVGYSFNSSLVMTAPSQEKTRQFDGVTFRKLCAKLEQKLQNRARTQEVRPVLDLPQLPPKAEIVKAPKIPPLSLKTPVADLPAYVPKVGSSNYKRRTLEEELRQAVLNTGGKLVE